MGPNLPVCHAALLAGFSERRKNAVVLHLENLAQCLAYSGISAHTCAGNVSPNMEVLFQTITGIWVISEGYPANPQTPIPLVLSGCTVILGTSGEVTCVAFFFVPLPKLSNARNHLRPGAPTSNIGVSKRQGTAIRNQALLSFHCILEYNDTFSQT